MPLEKRRVILSARVDPSTLKYLEDMEPESTVGRNLDALVEKARAIPAQ
jgi:hypothetical protein